ncbi:unknown [Clostridium sp. CAG:715]|nr:unknown [Clostridium sp. CAG:715]
MYKKIKMTDKYHSEFDATHVTTCDNVEKRLRNKCATKSLGCATSV